MDEIRHFGIQGMKWGVRRPTGPDGRIRNSPVRKNTSEDYNATKALRRAPASTLSNQQLRTVVERMELERRYSAVSSSSVNSGKRFASSVMRRIGNRVLDRTIDAALKTAFDGAGDFVRRRRS